MTVVVTERKHRSIELGVRYQTDEGPGGNIAWENRNFFGRGERVRAELDASAIAGFSPAASASRTSGSGIWR